MKKKLKKIFDEATPNELDRFSDALGVAEASDEELAAIKSKVYARLEIKKKKRAPSKIWLRAGIVAACVAVIVSVAALGALLGGGGKDVEPYDPTDATETGPTISQESNLYREYASFEDCIRSATDVFKGTCINIIEHLETIEYEFSVTERFLGEDTSSSVFVYVQRHSYTFTNEDGEMIEVNSGYPEEPHYEIGAEYYMLLSRDISVYYEHDRYHSFHRQIYLPVADISKSSMYGEPLYEHSELKKLSGEQELRDHIQKVISEIDLSSKPLYSGDPYIKSTDMKSIIEGSEYVIKIKVERKEFEGRENYNQNIYRCIVTESLSGEIAKDEIIDITFFPDTVCDGEEYIVAVDLSIDNRTPKLYHFSSKNSLFPIDQYDEIMQIINKAQ